MDLIAKVRAFARIRIKNDQGLIDLIDNAMDVFDRCRQNRNQVTHFDIQIALGEERSSGFNLVRRGRKPNQDPKQFDDRLQTLRRVAKEIWRLNARLKNLHEKVSANMHPEAVAGWPRWRTNAVAQKLTALPLPELLSETVRPRPLFTFAPFDTIPNGQPQSFSAHGIAGNALWSFMSQITARVLSSLKR